MKKLLPPQLFVLTILLMGVVCWVFDLHHYIPYPFNLGGIGFMILGIGIAQSSKMLFRKMETNVNTFENPDKLITISWFKYTRNPMYLGFVIALFGVAILYGGSISSFGIAILFFILTDVWYIRYEEQKMKETFGDDYLNYRQSTRKWI